MTAEEKIYAILSASSAVTALVPASRIKPPGDWQNLERPYIVHAPVGMQTTRTHKRTVAFREFPFYQVSIFAADYTSARGIAAAVAGVLDGYKDSDVDRIAYSRTVNVGYDTDFKIAHVAVDVEIAGALT